MSNRNSGSDLSNVETRNTANGDHMKNIRDDIVDMLWTNQNNLHSKYFCK